MYKYKAYNIYIYSIYWSRKIIETPSDLTLFALASLLPKAQITYIACNKSTHIMPYYYYLAALASPAYILTSASLSCMICFLCVVALGAIVYPPWPFRIRSWSLLPGFTSFQVHRTKMSIVLNRCPNFAGGAVLHDHAVARLPVVHLLPQAKVTYFVEQ